MDSFQWLPACCYYPTTVLLVDDNLDLLKDIAFALMSGPRKYKSKYSTSPKEIIDIVTRQGNSIEAFIKKHVSVSQQYFDFSQTIVNIDVSSIHKVLYETPIRFAQYIVLVVDYVMPNMNGLELCQIIRQTLKLPIKIIMLTREADQATAVQAFNDKSIDRFIVKGAPDSMEKLLNYIHALQTEFFQEMTHTMLESNPTHQQTLRRNPQFIELFNRIAHEHHIVEYYMLEESGSFLFLDAKKNVTQLIIKTEEDIQSLYELAIDDRNTPAETIEALQGRKKLAYFPDKERHQAAKHWRLWEAQPLPGENTGYYAMIKGTTNSPLDKEKIISYQDFLYSK